MKYLKVILLFLIVVVSGCGGSDDNDFEPIVNNPKEEEQNQPPEEEIEITWITMDIPADAGEGKIWEFQTAISDNFEYEAPADDKGSDFTEKWDDWYHNAWTGPEPTLWKRDHSFVSNNELHITASRETGKNSTYAGIITSKQRVTYPVYVEARVKIMNSTLANAVWLLSPDDTQEIDIIEAYGSDRWNNAWFGPDRIHLSHHVFIRSPFQDWQPHDEGSFYTDGSTIWREDYHHFGVYWKDPWNLEYYIDGKLVRTRSGELEIDPLGYTDGQGLHKEMDIIIDAEDQTWRADDGLSPTDAELSDLENNTYKVDWIRVFKPIDN